MNHLVPFITRSLLRHPHCARDERGKRSFGNFKSPYFYIYVCFGCIASAASGNTCRPITPVLHTHTQRPGSICQSRSKVVRPSWYFPELPTPFPLFCFTSCFLIHSPVDIAQRFVIPNIIRGGETVTFKPYQEISNCNCLALYFLCEIVVTLPNIGWVHKLHLCLRTSIVSRR